MEATKLSLVKHLTEVRRRLIFTAVFFFLSLMVSFIWVKDFYRFLIKDLEMKLTVLGPTDILWTYFMLAGAIAMVGTIPVILFQVWQFIKLGLHDNERKVVRLYIPAIFILFISGIMFGYYVILPTLLDFFHTLGEEMFYEMYTVQKYFSFVLGLTIPFAFLFLLPLVSTFLTGIGVIHPTVLTKYRKYAYFILVIISAMISPPDFLSQFVVAIPLMFIYEVGVICAKVVYRKKQ